MCYGKNSERTRMEKFEINILGCGSALPTTRHNPSSQVISIRDKWFMIDCGEGTQLQLRRSHIPFMRINHVLISHLHGDHCYGLPGMLSTWGLMKRQVPLHIYAHADLQQLLQPWLHYFCEKINYEVVFHSINPMDATCIYEDHSLSITTIPLRHRLPCCGFLFREKPTPRHIMREWTDFHQVPLCMFNRLKNGEDYTKPDGTVVPNECLTSPSTPVRSYAYCSDTAPFPPVIPIITGVDMLYHEATFAQSE